MEHLRWANEGCHPILRDEDIEAFEINPHKFGEPICVQLHKKNLIRMDVPKKAIVGNVFERNGALKLPKAPMAPTAFNITTTINEEQKMHAEIDRENREALQALSLEEICDEQEALKASLSVRTFAYLQRKR